MWSYFSLTCWGWLKAYLRYHLYQLCYFYVFLLHCGCSLTWINGCVMWCYVWPEVFYLHLSYWMTIQWLRYVPTVLLFYSLYLLCFHDEGAIYIPCLNDAKVLDCRYFTSLGSDFSALNHCWAFGLFRFSIILALQLHSLNFTAYVFLYLCSKYTCTSGAVARLQKWGARLQKGPWGQLYDKAMKCRKWHWQRSISALDTQNIDLMVPVPCTFRGLRSSRNFYFIGLGLGIQSN